MRTWIKPVAGVLALVGTLSGCDDYLSGPGLTTDPNVPSVASADQLFHASQLVQFTFHEGDLARHSSMFVQQMAGIGNQLTSRGKYVLSDQDLASWMDGLYIGGGLIDLREIQKRATESGDRVYAGIAKVWEAYTMGMAASLWGDLPYSEAVNPEIAAPKFDDQARIYAAVQKVLDEAIADLQSGVGRGPGVVDAVYGGDAQKWIQAAHTLRARFYMHWVEAQEAGGASAALANTACGGDCVQKALAAAQNGIASPAGNLTFPHTATPGEENLWYQFMFVQRAGQITAGRALVELMQERNDPRVTLYFAPVGGEVIGSDPGERDASPLNPAVRGNPGFDQPQVTYAENQLIMAEAQFRLGSEAGALAHLNNARVAEGLPAISGLSGSALLREIALEKYIALFQNIEAWNDYKRLCQPVLTPAAGTEVIGRLLYSDNEKNTNPNVPVEADELPRNENDPRPCQG